MISPFHWRFDGRLHAPLLDQQPVLALLYKLVEQSGLTPICAPQVSWLPPNCCGIIMIAESHIAVDVYDQTAYVHMFSCRPFDVDRAIEMISDHLPGMWRSIECQHREDQDGHVP